MNPHTMNDRSLILIAALALATPIFGAESVTEKAKEKASEAWDATKDAAETATRFVTKESREAWAKTKAYLSTDPATYRQGATDKLKELDGKIGTRRKPERWAREIISRRGSKRCASKRRMQSTNSRNCRRKRKSGVPPGKISTAH
jgi:hypothetical protein